MTAAREARPAGRATKSTKPVKAARQPKAAGNSAAAEARLANSAPRSLDVPEIIRSVRTIVSANGLDALSMRALARELGVSPMAVYYHVGSKKDLLALLIDDILKHIEVPPPDFGSWEDRLRELSRRSAGAMAMLPGIDQAMVNMRPTPEGWRLIDAYVQILLDGGFSERNAALGYSVIHSYSLGRSGMVQRLTQRPRRGVQLPEELQALHQVQGQWNQLHRADYRDFALEVMIAGLHAIVENRPPESDSGKTAGRTSPRRTAKPSRGTA